MEKNNHLKILLHETSTLRTQAGTKYQCTSVWKTLTYFSRDKCSDLGLFSMSAYFYVLLHIYASYFRVDLFSMLGLFPKNYGSV